MGERWQYHFLKLGRVSVAGSPAMATLDLEADLEAYLEKPLTPEAILDIVFDASKAGLGKLTPEELQAHISTSADIVTAQDEKGWTPLLWASFHGHWEVH